MSKRTFGNKGLDPARSKGRRGQSEFDRAEFQEVSAGMEGLDDLEPVLVPVQHYDLPSGHFVVCLSDEEEALCKETVKPYLEVGAGIPDEAWLHIKSMLELVLLKERVLSQTRRPDFSRMDQKSQKDVRSSIIALNNEITEFARRLDPLKNQRGDDGLTPAEWRAEVMERGLKYAQEHIGEFTWMAICPNPDCAHNSQPFFMILETPHFAMDPAAGPNAIWNEECAELVHKQYCQKPGCEHLAHRRGYTGGLAVKDAARILRISPLGLLALAWERRYDLGLPTEIDLDQIETLKRYVQ